MRSTIFTCALALLAPLGSMAAPTTPSTQSSIDRAQAIVSSLHSTLTQHEANINSTLSSLPTSLSAADKKTAASSVNAQVGAMNDAVHAAVASAHAVARVPSGSASAAQKAQAQGVARELAEVTDGTSATVKNAKNVLGNENIVVVDPFVAIFEAFVLDVEDLLIGAVPGLEVLGDALVGLLETILLL